MIFITISRQTGSMGKEIAELLAQKTGLPLITRDLAITEWLPEIANKHELHMLAESPSFFLNTSSSGLTFAQYLENKLKDFIARQPAIIFGLGSQIIFARHPSAIHVKIIASPEVRTTRIMHQHNLEKKDAERFLELTDRKHKRYISLLYGKDWADPLLYHIVLNTDNLSTEEGAALLYYLVENRQVSSCQIVESRTEKEIKPLVFKHPSEEEFARILDMYGLEWEYEPRTFPIEWDSDGNITMAFSPDFYLPGFNTYIELTTMNPKYASEKKKKVQLLKKLYPDTNINIVLKNDYNALLKRFGLQKGSDI